MNRRRSRFSVPRLRGGDSLAATTRPRRSSTEAKHERRRVGSRFVFRFVVGAAVICSVAALRVDAVGRVLSDPPVNHAAYVAQAAAGANAGAGQALYAKAGCENCHGPNGQGTAAGPRIAGTARQLPAFVAYVRKPTGTMPPQSAQVVSDRALADIFAFLRSAPQAVSTRRGARSRRTRPTRTHPLRRDAPTRAPRCTRRSAATSATRIRRRADRRGRASVPTRSPSPASPNTYGIQRATCRRIPRRCCRTRNWQISMRSCRRGRGRRQ